MVLDWFIYGLLTWALAALLNATAFRREPAGRPTAWVLAVVVFCVNVVALTVLQFMRYRYISQDLGFEIRPRSPMDLMGAFLFAWLFLSLLKKRPKQGRAPSPRTSNAPPVQEAASAKAQAVTGPSTPALEIDEEFWSGALAEYESDSRRSGLYARVFAESQGNEPVAKAMYLKVRAVELRNEHEARAQARQRETRVGARLAESARLHKQQQAYELTPKGTCPNCYSIIPLESETCPRCKALFGPGSAWSVTPLRET